METSWRSGGTIGWNVRHCSGNDVDAEENAKDKIKKVSVEGDVKENSASGQY